MLFLVLAKTGQVRRCPFAGESVNTGMEHTPNQPKAKMSKTQWLEVKARAELGESYESIAMLFPINPQSMRDRATKEKWCTPARIERGMRNELAHDDPAQAVANVWKERKELARNTVYNGTRKALDRFFAMSPIPQSFSEAAIAAKLMNDSISPPEDNQPSVNMNLAVLTSVGFSPRQSDD